MTRAVLLSGLFLGGVAAAWVLGRAWRVIAIGSAYKAKVLASIVFGSGRSVDPEHAEEVSAGSYWPMRLLRARVSAEARSVTVSFPGSRPRTAIYREGYGATLLGPGSGAQETAPPGTRSAVRAAAASPPAEPLSLPAPPVPIAWPDRRGSTALADLVESAFREPDPRRLRRTRAILILRDGEVLAERYAPGFGRDTRLAGWSMTKSVLGALVGILVGEGRLSLGDAELLPEWRAPDPRAAIALEDLLRMRSGLRFSEEYSNLSSDVIQMLFNHGDTVAYAASRPLDFPPGAVWSYSSGTTNILSKVARRVLGEADYAQWPRRALFGPAGMTSAVMEPDEVGTFVGSSFMLATARDWARFGELHLQDGVLDGRQILPEGWVRFSTAPTPESPGGNYGAHWWLKLNPELGGDTPAAERIPADAFHAVGHEIQVLTVIPSLNLVVLRLGLSIEIDAWDHAAFLASLRDVL